MTYTVHKKQCRCQAGCCVCRQWSILDDGQDFLEGDDEELVVAVADALNELEAA